MLLLTKSSKDRIRCYLKHNLHQTQQLSARHEPLGYPMIRVDNTFLKDKKDGQFRNTANPCKRFILSLLKSI